MENISNLHSKTPTIFHIGVVTVSSLSVAINFRKLGKERMKR